MVDDELDITLTLKIALEQSGFFQVEAFYDPADIFVNLHRLNLETAGDSTQMNNAKDRKMALISSNFVLKILSGYSV